MSEVKPLRPLLKTMSIHNLFFRKEKGKWSIITNFLYTRLIKQGKKDIVFRFTDIQDKDDLNVVKSLYRKICNKSVKDFNDKVKVYNEYAKLNGLDTIAEKDFFNEDYFNKEFGN